MTTLKELFKKGTRHFPLWETYVTPDHPYLSLCGWYIFDGIIHLIVNDDRTKSVYRVTWESDYECLGSLLIERENTEHDELFQSTICALLEMEIPD